MKCYLMSEPFKRGNRRKAYGLWQDIIETTEQRWGDQVGVIKSNEWLSKVEMEEIKRNIEM